MNAKITVLSLTLVMSGCAIQTASVVGPDDKQGYTINCHSGLDQCHKKAAVLCPNGYDIIEHIQKSSTVVPHYGEYPMTINIENLTIGCN